jgi:hypothetical protein
MYRSYEDDYKTLSNEDYFKFKFNEEHSIITKSNKKSSVKDLRRNLHDSKIMINVSSNDSESDGASNGVERLHKSNSTSGKNADSSNQDSKNESHSEKKVGKWTENEDEILKELVPLYGGKSWKKIAENIKGRTPIQCLHRWTKILQPGLVKGPWSIQEDRKLIEWVKKEGPTRWSQCAEFISGRNGKQCRERWFNSLNPQVKKGNWSAEEDFKLFFFYKKFGGKWAKTALYFEGRTENSLKNRFYSTLRRIASEKKKIFTEEQNSTYELDEKHKLELLEDQDNSVMNDATMNSYVGLDELKKFISCAEEVVKYQFMVKKDFNHKDIENYESKLIEMMIKSPKLVVKSFKVEKLEKDMEKAIKTEKSTNMNALNNSTNINNNNNSTINVNLNFNNNNNNNSNTNYIIGNPQNNLSDVQNISNLNNFNNFNNLNGMNNINNFNNSSLFDNNFSNNYNNSNYNMYKNMDIYSLENNIAEMCDGSLFFPDAQKMNLDSQIDNFLDNIFNNSNIIVNNDPMLDCNLCGEKPVDNFTKNDVFSKFFENSNQLKMPVQPDRTTKNFNLEDGFKTPMANKNNSSINNKEVWKLKCENGKNKNDVFQNLLSQLNGLERLVKSAKKELSRYEKNDTSDEVINVSANYSFDNLFKL